MNVDTKKLILNGKIKHWEDALPIGNGKIGGLLYGSINKLVLSLDRGDIWDTTSSAEDDPDFNYYKLLELKEAGDIKEIERIFDLPYNKPLPSKLPVGKIIFNIGKGNTNVFELDLNTAEAKCTADNRYFKTFIHANHTIGMAKSNNYLATATLIPPNFGVLKEGESQKVDTTPSTFRSLKNVYYKKPIFEREKIGNISLEYYIQSISDDMHFGVALATKQTMSDTEFAYTIFCGDNITTLLAHLKERIFDSLTVGYEKLFKIHKIWWREYNKKSSLTLEDKSLELSYNIGNYLLGAASRKGNYPMPLQGVWTQCDGENLPPWHGDYHLDLNVQMTYSNYLKANHTAEGECLTDYLVSLTDRAREYATTTYKADGICLPSVMSITGYGLGGWAMYSMSPTNQLWLCQIMDRHYNYTRDEQFFNKVAYPYISESAKFILSLLKEGEDGMLVLPWSSSPEIHNNTLKSFLTPNTNYDQALIMYVFRVMVRYAKQLKLDASVWENALSKLHPLAVNSDNVYMLSRTESLNESHRHQSHAMAIYPLKLINDRNERDKAIIKATVDNAKKYGPSAYTGYSMAWLAEFAVAMHDGDTALDYLKGFYKKYCSRNTFHVNFDCNFKKLLKIGKYGPFTLEGNFCALDAIQDMLFYAEDGIIEFFPALPTKWTESSFNGFRGYDGIIASAKYFKGNITEIKIEATVDCTFEILNNLKGYNFRIGCDGIAPAQTISLRAREVLTITK